MSCPKTDIISTYLDEEMGQVEKNAFETHYQGCTSCSQALDELRTLRAAFAKVERHPAPYGFATRVMARVAEREKESLWSVPFYIRFAEAGILLAVITVGILAGKVMTNGSPMAQTTNLASSLSLDVFDAAPPGSLGNSYLAMTEVRHEK